MFATGIENSYPVITARDGRPHRVDQMAKCGFYERWKEDFSLVDELGLEYLRYGPAYYRMHQGPGRYDWEFSDETFAELARLKITPIADLCHFGVPGWIGDFQNPDWPELFGQFAGAFAGGVAGGAMLGSHWQNTGIFAMSALAVLAWLSLARSAESR